MPKLFTPTEQLSLSFDSIVANANVFRPIHYLGSKLRILDFIEDTINQVDVNRGRVVDLFAGSGSVAHKLSMSRNVTSVDIQEYSRVLCSAILNPKYDSNNAREFVDECKSSKYFQTLLNCIKPLIEHEEYCINRSLSNDSSQLCSLLEDGSIISYELNNAVRKSSLLNSALDSSIKCLHKNLNIEMGDAVAIRYFGGIYFSYFQAAQIDSILFQISKISEVYKDCYKAALLSTVSDAVNTIGKQFAQPIRPRTSSGEPKPNLGKSAQKDRDLDIFEIFGNWLTRYKSIVSLHTNQALRMDYADALDILPVDTTVVYADPPYTRDHYSRFYHVLETLCLKDNPAISTTVLNGQTQISRGIYRQSRHQSPFCIKKQAPEAFKKLFIKTKQAGASLILSYSPFDENKKVHPRVVNMGLLISMAKAHYKHVEVTSPGIFTHSKLNHSNKNLEASKQAEVLIICQE